VNRHYEAFLSTATEIPFVMRSNIDHFTPAAGLTCTITIRKPGGTWGAATGTITEVSGGSYYWSAAAGDLDALGYTFCKVSATGADDLYFQVAVKPVNVDAAVQTIANDAITAAAIKADAVTEIQAGLSTLDTGDIPTAANIADAVLDERVLDHAGAGTLGLLLYNTYSDLTAFAAKFFGITLVANWLRGLARKDTMDATAKMEINDGGGSYNEATDSSEAIRDAMALETTLTAMRGADSDTLETLSDQLDTLKTASEAIRDAMALETTLTAMKGADGDTLETLSDQLDTLKTASEAIRDAMALETTLTAMRGADGDTLETLSDQLDTLKTAIEAVAGVGSTINAYITKGPDGLPLPGATVYMRYTLTGAVYGPRVSNGLGQTFWLGTPGQNRYHYNYYPNLNWPDDPDLEVHV